MSFLKIGDRAAGAISPAAPPGARKMVIVDTDHPTSRRSSTEGERGTEVANLVTARSQPAHLRAVIKAA